MARAVEEMLRVWLRESDMAQLDDDYIDRIIESCHVDAETGLLYVDIRVWAA